jgi:hypothetical protein
MEVTNTEALRSPSVWSLILLWVMLSQPFGVCRMFKIVPALMCSQIKYCEVVNLKFCFIVCSADIISQLEYPS